MPPRLDGRLPLGALRDLIGVVRALYAAWVKSCVGPVELEGLASIGRELQTALDLARKTSPNTMGHRAAWDRAERATKRLGAIIDEAESLRPTVAAAAGRVLGASQAGTTASSSQREAKSRHGRMRN